MRCSFALVVIWLAALGATKTFSKVVCWPSVVEASTLAVDSRLLVGEEKYMELYQRALQGDDEAMTTLFREMFPLLESFLTGTEKTNGITKLRTNGSIAHEVLLIVGEYLLAGKSTPNPFLNGAFYLAWERGWGEKRERLTRFEDELAYDDRAMDFLDQLAPNYAEIALLDHQGMTWREIAQKVNLPQRTVHAAVPRVRKLLMQSVLDDAAGIRDRYIRAMHELPERTSQVLQLYREGFAPYFIQKALGLKVSVDLMVTRADAAVRNKIASPLDENRELFAQAIALLPERDRKIMEFCLKGIEPLQIASEMELKLSTVEGVYYSLQATVEAALLDAGTIKAEEERKFLDRVWWPIGERRALEDFEKNLSIAYTANRLKIKAAAAKTLLTKAQKRLAAADVPMVDKTRFYERVLPYLQPYTKAILELSLKNHTPKQIAELLGLRKAQVQNQLQRYRVNIDDAFIHWVEPADGEALRRELALATLGPKQRRALQRHLSGVANQQIAIELDLTLRATATLVSQTKEIFEEALAREAHALR